MSSSVVRRARRGSVALALVCLALLAAGRGFASEAHVGLAEGRAAIDPGRRPGLRWQQAEGPVTVFVAKKIVTMSPSQPEATAVAVLADRILGVGSLESLEVWTEGREHRIDRSFADKVLMPGFIEPHLHPYIAAILLPMTFIAPHAWSLPTGEFEAVRGREPYLARLAAALEESPGSDIFWTWGYHPGFHGRIGREDLDALSPDRPLIVWHRSFHEIFLNTKALEVTGIDLAAAAAHPAVELERGRFYETGLQLALPFLAPVLFAPERYMRGLELGAESIHRGGITTVMDGAFGTINLETEWKLVKHVWDREQTPFRSILLPDGANLRKKLGSWEETRDLIASLPQRDTHRLLFPPKAVKLFADGAFYSQLMQLEPPGYLDGHEGEWLMTPAELLEGGRVFWNDGFQINVHANGDGGVGAALDVLETLQREHPRRDHRYCLHHFGYSTPAQGRRLGALGGIVSANPFYLWALADRYSEVGLGPERASQMVRLGSLEREGTSFSLHSDFTMAPAEPLRLAWVAANRVSADGVLMAPDERISREAALRAITIEAAYLLQLENEIGSIEVGKKADFTVLEADPTTVPIGELADVPIWGTVFEGRVFPLAP